MDPSSRAGVPGEPSGVVAQISQWLAEQRSLDAVAARTRERWLRQQAQEEGTFAGMLLDLGERRCRVVVQVAGDRRHHGVVRAVAGDFLVLETDRSLEVLLRFEGIVSVRPEVGAPVSVGDRTVALDTTLGETLTALAGERPWVVAVTTDGTVMAGQLRAAGRDFISLRLDGPDRATVYVALSALAEIGLTER